MALEDVKFFAFITKYGLYDWTVMPFGMKNATNIFIHIMIEIFDTCMDKFLKVFIDDLNTHNLT